MNYPAALINKNGELKERLCPVSPKEKIFDETLLQEVLMSAPELLPVNEIDASWNKLIPLGREVSMTSGFIDNLYVTPEGLLCIVETKLWRNPEAHRTVVAQVIDYAKDLSKMSLNEFKKAVEKSKIKGETPGFSDRVSRHIKNIGQIEFESKIQESLNSGRFMLLIVGDKIYPELAMLAETIQAAPNLEFKIGMIEFHIFKKDREKPWPLLIIPKVIGKTHEVIRSVVRIVYEEKKPDVDVSTIEEPSSAEKTDKKTLIKSMPEDFGDIFGPMLERWIADSLIISWGKIGIGLRISWKGKITTVSEIYPDMITLVTDKNLKAKDFALEAYRKYRQTVDEIPYLRQMMSEGRRFISFKDLTLEEFKLLLDATDNFARELNDKKNNKGHK